MPIFLSFFGSIRSIGGDGALLDGDRALSRWRQSSLSVGTKLKRWLSSNRKVKFLFQYLFDSVFYVLRLMEQYELFVSWMFCDLIKSFLICSQFAFVCMFQCFKSFISSVSQIY